MDSLITTHWSLDVFSIKKKYLFYFETVSPFVLLQIILGISINSFSSFPTTIFLISTYCKESFMGIKADEMQRLQPPSMWVILYEKVQIHRKSQRLCERLVPPVSLEETSQIGAQSGTGRFAGAVPEK